jgi:uncharacterized membrane protein YcaP (DUF421 family)
VSATNSKFRRFGAAADGAPLTLLKNGAWQNAVLQGMKIDPEDVMAAARTKGVSSIHDVA